MAQSAVSTDLHSGRMAITLNPETRNPELDELTFIDPRPIERDGDDQPTEPPGRRRLEWLRAGPDDPRWARPALFALLAATAVLYIWGLGASGWANSFYSAAAQAGSQSWKALFFGSSDASNFITVDKPPASLWIMGLSIRVFGLSVVEHPRPRGVDGRGLRRRAVRHGEALVRRRRRPARRRRARR